MIYIKQNKWKVFTTVIIIGAVFFAFKTTEKQNGESPEIRHRKLLSTIGYLLETEHYSPRKIDDDFSKDVFKEYLKALDPEKNIFLQSDINALRVYETKLDDEINIHDNIKTFTAIEAYEQVLNDVGSSFKRDAVDSRILLNVKEGNTDYKNGIIDSQENVGGWPILISEKAQEDYDEDGMPDAWEYEMQLNSKSNDSNLNTLDKTYTNIEVYCNSLVNAISKKIN